MPIHLCSYSYFQDCVFLVVLSHIQTHVVVDFLFIVTPIVGVCNCSMFCCTLLCVHSSIAIILMGKRELVALLNLSSWCLVMVERLFLAVPWGCLRFVIVVFPDHTLNKKREDKEESKRKATNMADKVGLKQRNCHFGSNLRLLETDCFKN